MIEGIIITPLKQIVDERGKIMHMLRRDSNVFKSFGEIYFSTVNPKFIKAWHKHKEATLNYACIKGNVKRINSLPFPDSVPIFKSATLGFLMPARCSMYADAIIPK